MFFILVELTKYSLGVSYLKDEGCSDTLQELLALVNDSLKGSLPTALICHIVRSVLTGTTSMLQPPIGLLLSEKNLQEYLYKYIISINT